MVIQNNATCSRHSEDVDSQK